MSIIQTIAAACPTCGTQGACTLVSSINADRRPDLREDVLEDRLQVLTCTECATEYRVPPALSYVDFERGQWILAYPPAALASWRELEKTALDTFESAFGRGAIKAAQELGARMSPRIAFGWPALREKLVAHELKLDDADLETMKLAIMRGAPKQPAADIVDLRLDGADADGLVLSWTERDTGMVLTSVNVPRTLYDDVTGDTDSWAQLRADIATGAFVDLNRMLLA